MGAASFVLNGVNARTGKYLLEEKLAEEISAYTQGAPLDAEQVNELRWRYAQKDLGTYGTMAGVDPFKLEEAGWGVIFAHDADPAVREALAPLLAHRQAHATQKKQRYQEFSGAAGHRPGETKNTFPPRHRVGPGPANPDKMPYYLLIVGDPDRIPYRFQYQLDVQCAVGCLHFDTVEEDARYARSVVKAETADAARPRRAVFFGTRNKGDKATQLSADL